MKNQYFGDINDYRKYGLLRILAGENAIQTAVCWMLTDADGRSDGRHVGYLKKPEQYRKYDPVLFDMLHESVVYKRGRNVRCAEDKNLIPGAVFFSNILTDVAADRRRYFGELAVALTNCDLVFFDQDNGMEVASVPYGKKGSSKYLYWHELLATFQAGHSVLLYQHFPRKDHAEFANELFRDLCNRLGVSQVISFVTSNVLFLLLPQSKHYGHFQQCALKVSEAWGDEISYSFMKLN